MSKIKEGALLGIGAYIAFQFMSLFTALFLYSVAMIANFLMGFSGVLL